ncbi:hypothetical protein L933_01410 [Helicobacter pylori PZ5056]|uniref:Uncharacterized protein n=1 Tax=Helicobacter pylori PZ5056 TaxID=1337393 RepID=T2T2Z9_HELPX|nr:hypothetical protein HPNQ4216_0288 [Helicobacter pylori NQ4216]EQD98998.1 hypothetical protein L933_01410 [Helicobacter pylori PZ5056]
MGLIVWLFLLLTLNVFEYGMIKSSKHFFNVMQNKRVCFNQAMIF